MGWLVKNADKTIVCTFIAQTTDYPVIRGLQNADKRKFGTSGLRRSANKRSGRKDGAIPSRGKESRKLPIRLSVLLRHLWLDEIRLSVVGAAAKRAFSLICALPAQIT